MKDQSYKCSYNENLKLTIVTYDKDASPHVCMYDYDQIRVKGDHSLCSRPTQQALEAIKQGFLLN